MYIKYVKNDSYKNLFLIFLSNNILDKKITIFLIRECCW